VNDFSDGDFVSLPVTLLQFGAPLKIDIYFRSPVHRTHVLFKHRGEVIDISQFEQVTRTGVKLVARKQECEAVLAALEESEEDLHATEDPDLPYWSG
jgi:hypothetical protein